jgi:glycogen debranching enzyme
VVAKILVGPPVLTINRGSTFMVTDHSGEIDPGAAQGVFADDTRFVSGYRLRINGQPWQLVSSSAVSYHSARIYLSNPPLTDFSGALAAPASSLGLRLLRSVDEGVHEILEIASYLPVPVRLVLELEIDSDFADLFEVKEGQIRDREELVTEWDRRGCRLVTTYRHADYLRRFTYQVLAAEPSPFFANGRLRFPVHLAPGATWRARANMQLQHGRRVRKPRSDQVAPGATGGRAGRLHQRWLSICTRLETPADDLRQAYRASVDDLGALRLFEQDLGPDVWVPAAGVPWFVTVFGRDSLIASLQSACVHARFVEGTLRVLASYQATERDDWRDAQPGKIVHEIRHGELAHFNLVPHTRYYGTWDATPLFLIALRQAWRWLGDRALLEALLPAAERGLEWIDSWGDLDGDGFQEYRTFSTRGYQNMGWKDAHDAVVYPDGSLVEQPKALCELQGYVYEARRGLAELYTALGQPERAAALEQQAADLKRRFNQAFWLEQEGTYAFGLDKTKRQIGTVASNAGHCLWSGIADADKAARVAQRLLAPDMWSGWGIRTLAASNPAYNPFSYQSGSVWPHDNAIIAAGFARYGLHAQAHQVARGILDAASHFSGYRLPEVFAGLPREAASFPVQYLGANIPQAWAAGSVFQLVQAMLGLEADAPNSRLTVDPHLPDWVPALELIGLEVGQTRLHLRFWREGSRTRWAVQAQRGPRLEVGPPAVVGPASGLADEQAAQAGSTGADGS